MITNPANCVIGRTTRLRFTLLELLAAMAVFVILLAVIFQLINGVENFWTLTRRKLEVTENARVAFAAISADLKSMVAGGAEGRKIFVDAAGIGERLVAFIATDPTAPSNGSPLFEVGYGIDSGARIRRWSSSDMDAQWNFIDADPAIWAADSSWGQVSTVILGALNFTINFYKADAAPPYYAAYNATTDSDELPAFADISMTLIHPRTLAGSITEQNKTKQTYRNRIMINQVTN